VLGELGIKGPVALISAGWRYDEDRDEPLRAAIGLPVHNLRLYHTFQELERVHPDLAGAHARKQQELKRAKESYRIAISAAVGAFRRLWPARRDADRPWVAAIVDHLRDLDALFLAQCDALHTRFAMEARPDRNPLVRTLQAKVEEVLAGSSALLIAGGHVGVLRNRIAFFGLEPLLTRRPVVAWSGGAMVLSDRVLLYHDHTAFGVGTAELLDRGFGLVSDAVFLPHARERLALDDTAGVALLARRLAPAQVLGLQNGAVLAADGRSIGAPEAVLRLQTDGTVHAAGA